MNKKLIGGIVVLGGISVIAYYFLFSKKSEKKLEEDLLKKFEENKNFESAINVDLKLTEGTIDFTKRRTQPFDSLSQKELEEVYSHIDKIGQPVINIQPIDLTSLEKLGLGSVDWAEAIKKAGY